uniref:Uncharacterized protein n=1 Tax=Oryza nivara TaxID=4536 RepID=A0A0E0FVR8_ORYNI
MQAKAPGDQTRGALAGHAVRRSQGRGFGYGHPLPSVVGLPVAEAKRRIKQCRPDVYIEVLSAIGIRRGHRYRRLAKCNKRHAPFLSRTDSASDGRSPVLLLHPFAIIR